MSSDRPEETAAEPEPRLGTAVRYRLRLAVAEHHWPRPPLRTRARRAGERWATGGARWAWTHRPRRQAVGSVQQEHQP